MSDAFIGSVQFNFSTLTSTNRFALSLLSKTRPRAGTVISAAYQTAGEGQFGRSWHATKGKNLSLSAILFPTIAPSKQFALSAFAALAVRKTVAELTGSQVSVKWPNDIYVGERKVAGILIHNSITAKTITSSVVGIGLNVNELKFPEGIGSPTSIALITGKVQRLNEVKSMLLANLNTQYFQLNNHPVLMGKYHRNMYKLGETTTFTDLIANKTIESKVLGVDSMGRIRLEREGNEQTHTLNEIRFTK